MSEISKGFVAEHAAYWSDKEIIGYAMDESFIHELDKEDLIEMVVDLAVRLDAINLTDDDFEEDYSDDDYNGPDE